MNARTISRLKTLRILMLWFAAVVVGMTLWILFDHLARDQGGQILFHLVIGWVWHLEEHVPELGWNNATVFRLLGLLAVVAATAHFTLRHIFAGPWPLRRTLLLMALPFCLIGAAGALCMTGHHVSWLPRESSFYYSDRWDSTINVSNARQLITALRIYASDHGGEYPAKLEDLVTEKILDRKGLNELSHALMQKRMQIPWLVLGGLNDSAPGDLPLVVSSIPLHGRRYVMGTNDSSVRIVQPGEYHAAMAAWEAYLKENHKTRSAIPLR